MRPSPPKFFVDSSISDCENPRESRVLLSFRSFALARGVVAAPSRNAMP